MDDVCAAGSGGLPGELEDLLEDFTGYLRRERSLVSTTVENYLNQVRPFAVWCAHQRQSPLAELTVREVNRFLVWRAGSCSVGSLAVAATALRALVRWMFLDGRLARQLAEGVGPVRYPALAGVGESPVRGGPGVDAGGGHVGPGPSCGGVGPSGVAFGRGRRAAAGGCGLARGHGARHRGRATIIS